MIRSCYGNVSAAEQYSDVLPRTNDVADADGCFFGPHSIRASIAKEGELINLLLLKAYHSPFNTVVQVRPSYALGVKFVVNEHKACLRGADTSAMLEQPQLARLDCQWYSCALGLVTVDVNVSPGVDVSEVCTRAQALTHLPWCRD